MPVHANSNYQDLTSDGYAKPLPHAMTVPNSPYEIELKALPDHSTLESMWRDLEARSPTTSFFNSWSWIGHWLAMLPPRFERRLLEARHEGRLVGLGVLVRNRRKLGKLPLCTSWHLHAAGDAIYDGAMVEHNDFLIDGQHGDALRAAMVQCWTRSVGPAQELSLPGLEGEGYAPAVSGRLGRRDEPRTSYVIPLQPVRDHKLDFTPLVSGHARRFIRRSIKEYQTLGPLAVHVAGSPDQALSYFDRMVALHQERWSALGEDGSFKSEFRSQLHRRVIGTQFGHGEIQMLRVSAGERDIGYLYSFIRGKRLYVYQSGFDYTVLEKHGRPGLVTHTLAVQHNAGLDFDVYDLMAGESQYKTTISTAQETLTWSVWYKPAIRFSLERQLRNAVESYRRWKSRPTETEVPQPTADSDPDGTQRA